MLARSIQIGGSPLGRVDRAMGTLVAEVNSIIRDNYGQVYSLFIERLIGLSETRRGQLREQFGQRRRCYEEEAKGILGRQASVFAAAEAAGWLIEEILELRDLNPDGVVNRIFARVCDEAESDGPRNALVEILGWADANDDYFSHRLLDGSLAPARPGEKLGHKDPNSVAIYPAKLKEMLRRFGYDIKTTLGNELPKSINGGDVRTRCDGGSVCALFHVRAVRSLCLYYRISTKPTWLTRLLAERVTPTEKKSQGSRPVKTKRG